MTDEKDFGELLREARKRSGLSAREAAEKVGVAMSFIYDSEKGQKSPKYETVVKLAEVYNDSEIISEFVSMRNISVTPLLLDTELITRYLTAEEQTTSPDLMRERITDYRNKLVHGMVDDIIEKDPNAIHKIMRFLQKYEKDLTKEDDE